MARENAKLALAAHKMIAKKPKRSSSESTACSAESALQSRTNFRMVCRFLAYRRDKAISNAPLIVGCTMCTALSDRLKDSLVNDFNPSAIICIDRRGFKGVLFHFWVVRLDDFKRTVQFHLPQSKVSNRWIKIYGPVLARITNLQAQIQINVNFAWLEVLT